MNRILIILFVSFIIIIALFAWFSYRARPNFLVSLHSGQSLNPTPKPLTKYSIPTLHGIMASEANFLTGDTSRSNTTETALLKSDIALSDTDFKFEELSGEDSQFNNYIFSF